MRQVNKFTEKSLKMNNVHFFLNFVLSITQEPIGVRLKR